MAMKLPVDSLLLRGFSLLPHPAFVDRRCNTMKLRIQNALGTVDDCGLVAAKPDIGVKEGERGVLTEVHESRSDKG